MKKGRSQQPKHIIHDPTRTCPYCSSTQVVVFITKDGEEVVSGCWECGWLEDDSLIIGNDSSA